MSLMKLVGLALLAYLGCLALATLASSALHAGMGDGYKVFAFPLALFFMGWIAGWYGSEYSRERPRLVVPVISSVFVVATMLLFVLPIYGPHVLLVEKILVLAVSLLGPLMGTFRHRQLSNPG